MKKAIVLAFLGGAAVVCLAQSHRFPPIDPYAGDPTGNACTGMTIQQSSTTGLLYTCQSGTMKASGSTGSGTVSGQSSGKIPLATGATTIGSQSHLDDGVTTANTITSSVNVAVTGTVAAKNIVRNVLTYGADPTNTTDSSSAFMSCLQAGVGCYVPPGAYKISATIRIPNCSGSNKSVAIWGDPGTLPNGYPAVLNIAAGVTAFAPACPLTAYLTSTYRNLEIKGGLNGIDFGMAGITDIDHVTFWDYSGYAITHIKGEKHTWRDVFCWHQTVVATGCISLNDPTATTDAATYAADGYWGSHNGWIDRVNVERVYDQGNSTTVNDSYFVHAVGSRGGDVGEGIVGNARFIQDLCMWCGTAGIFDIEGDFNIGEINQPVLDIIGSPIITVPNLIYIGGVARFLTIRSFNPYWPPSMYFTNAINIRQGAIATSIINSSLGGSSGTYSGLRLGFQSTGGGAIGLLNTTAYVTQEGSGGAFQFGNFSTTGGSVTSNYNAATFVGTGAGNGTDYMFFLPSTGGVDNCSNWVFARSKPSISNYSLDLSINCTSASLYRPLNLVSSYFNGTTTVSSQWGFTATNTGGAGNNMTLTLAPTNPGTGTSPVVAVNAAVSATSLSAPVVSVTGTPASSTDAITVGYLSTHAGLTTIPPPTSTTLGGVNSYDCAATFGAGYGLQKINTNGSISCAQFASSTSTSQLVAVAGALTSDVGGVVAGTFTAGPSVTLAAGTWDLHGTVTVQTPGGSRNVFCKLWDGTNVLSSTSVYNIGSGLVGTMSLGGTAAPTGSTTYNIACTDNLSGTLIKAALPANSAGNNASTLVAVSVTGASIGGGISAGTTGQIPLYTANGVTLTNANTINQNNLPAAYNNAGPALSTNASLQSIFDPAFPTVITQSTNRDMWVPNTALSVYNQLPNIQGNWNPTTGCVGSNCSDASVYPGNGYLALSFDSTSIGFASSGLLTRVVVMPSMAVTTGANLQAWVIRPASFPTATGSQTYSFTVVAQVGEITDTTNGTYWEFSGLSIPVNAGDLIAFRVNNRGLVYGSGSGTYTNFRELRVNSATIASLSDTSINGLTVGQSVSFTTSSAARQYAYEADILPGPSYASANLKSTLLRLDSSGYIPDRIGRSYDMPWQGKKIIWVGTSIPANTTGGASYPTMVGTALQANMDNEAVGSSGMVWDGTTSRCLSLMATTAQLTSVCGAGFAPQSYQTKVLGKTADMLVIDHGHNDALTGTISDATVSTFYGAYNVLIAAAYADNPAMRIVLVTPPLIQDNGTNTAPQRAAIIAIGQKYQLPVVDLPALDGLSATTNYAAGGYCTTDGIHPTTLACRQLLARILYQALKGL